MIARISGLCLEIHSRLGKNNGVTYNNLIVYEFGRDYPEIRRIGIKPEHVEYCKSLCGKLIDVDVDVVEFSGRTSLYYVQANPVDKKVSA